MMYMIGDKVSVLDEKLTGLTVKIDGDTIAMEDVFVFDMNFYKNELAQIKHEAVLNSKSFLYVYIDEILSEKETSKRKPTIKKKVKERFQPTMEVDLHIHQLTNETNMSNHDMLTLQLDTARRQLDFAIRQRIQKVVFS